MNAYLPKGEGTRWVQAENIAEVLKIKSNNIKNNGSIAPPPLSLLMGLLMGEF